MLRIILLATVSLSAVNCLSADESVANGSRDGETVAPFPQNRVRDFYARQAEDAMAAQDAGNAVPELLPQFPGLDGGAFGHWGQNPAERSIDRTLNEVDSGNVICNRIIHFGSNTHKGVAVNLPCPDDATPHSVVFDPVRLTFIDHWTDGFVSRGSNRFGVHDGATAIGKQGFDLAGGRWQLPNQTATRYDGFYRHGRDVIFHYTIGTAKILDRISVEQSALVRSLEVSGDLPTGSKLVLAKGFQPHATSNSNVSAGISGQLRQRNTAIQIAAEGDCCEIQHRDGEVVIRFRERSENESGSSGSASWLIRIRIGEEWSDDFDLAGGVRPRTQTTGGPGQWVNRTCRTIGQRDTSSKTLAIDTLTVPYADQNHFGTPMRLAGVACLPDGRIAVSTLLGDVWIVSGVDHELRDLRWQRFAAGLYQPLGLVIQDGKIIVGGNDQITRLHDLNNDGEADLYECLTNDYPTTGGHDFATSLQQDQAGNLYWATAARDFGLTRLTPDGTISSLGNGLRNSNGIGVSPDGRITLATVQEGSWTPATAIFEVKDGSFHGHRGPKEGHGPYGYDLPLCFVPRGIDNSAGEICFLPKDNRLGVLSGQMIGTSYGYCSFYLVQREQVNGRVQGGIVPLPGEFLSGACRLRFNPNDGCIYVAGTEGWQSYAQRNGCLQRVRVQRSTGNDLHLPVKVETRSNGFIVHCSTKLDPQSVHLPNVFCQQWNYLFSAGYGSPEYSVRDEGRQGHDRVEVKSIHLLPNGRSVFVEIPQLHPVMQCHLYLRLKTAEGKTFRPDIYRTIYEMGPEFTEFPGYQLIAKRRWPDFPVAERYEQDPRLVEQDAFGTNFGWVSSATKLTLKAVTGLQYEPRRLRIAPGTRVALTFHNTDPGMPHNVVILPADKLESFGEQSMVLASNPRAIATHYVPNDPAEICFSPILNPGDQYTVYFEAPQQTGRYRFLCTYPGHWKVMRGSLFVLPDDQPLPPPAADEIGRRFVKRWQLSDFTSELVASTDASQRNGKVVFQQAGCIKCHRIGQDGSQLGPDLTEVTNRHTGPKLLQQILSPSSEIHPKYQTWIVVTDEGKVHAGLLLQQNESQVTLLPNPLRPDDTVQIQRANIEEMEASKQSTMPDGLLMTFTRQEILDLLAYLQQEPPVAIDP